LRRPDLLLIATWIALVCCTACGDAPNETNVGPAARPAGRVLLIGIDGASPALVDRLLAEGRLPHLADLARRGASGTIRSLVPIESPLVWNTIATGKLPADHGILGFAHPSADGTRALYLGTDRRVHALWNIASDAGRRVGVVNFWNTYPPDLIDGVMASDHLIARNIEGFREMAGAGAVPPGPVVHPADWQPRANQIVRDTTPLTSFANPLQGDPALPGYLALVGDDLPRRFDEDSALARLALAIDDELHPDLLMVLLPGVDRVSHFLWSSLQDDQSIYPEELRLSPSEQQAGRRALETFYAYVDALVGLLVARFGDDDVILVVSDHGFEPGRGLGILTGVHEGEAALDGIAFARGPGIAPGSSIRDFSVADVTPTLLAFMGLPLGDDMAGRVASFAPFGSTGEVETVPTHDTSRIARMPLGVSGAEGEIIEQLEQLGYIE
jgi:hypothetical protein